MAQEHDPHVVAGLGATIQIGDDREETLNSVRITAQQDRITAVDRDHGDGAPAALALRAWRGEHVVQHLSNFARGAVSQGDGVNRRAILIDLSQEPTNAPHIIGIVGHHHGAMASRGCSPPWTGEGTAQAMRLWGEAA